MRPAANFTLHAILAACLAALAASSAAAGGPTSIQLGGVQGGRIEVQSFHWGPRQSTSADGFIREKPHVAPGKTEPIVMEPIVIKSNPPPCSPHCSSFSKGSGANQMTMDDTAGKEAGRPTGTPDLTMKRGTSPAKPEVKREVMDYRMGDSGNAGPVGSSETMTVGGTRTEGQATGKRQHKPLAVQSYYDNPLPSGSLRVKVKMPWLACEEGRKMPSLELADGQKLYQLQDVSVASCGGTAEGPEESITFVYGKMVIK